MDISDICLIKRSKLDWKRTLEIESVVEIV